MFENNNFRTKVLIIINKLSHHHQPSSFPTLFELTTTKKRNYRSARMPNKAIQKKNDTLFFIANLSTKKKFFFVFTLKKGHIYFKKEISI